MQRARLIPVSGIANDKEAEQRAASAFLAVLSVVRDLSTELLSPLGASRASKATVECFTEVGFKLNGKTARPDGLIRVTFGKSSWTCLVEFKTGTARLDADQINDYWSVARAERFDHVMTISNEIAPVPGEHPTSGIRVRSNSRIQVSHYSWTAILTAAIRIKQHRGVDDPEQAWILGELIRYLEHPASGALAFNDMGSEWVTVRDAARVGAVERHDGATVEVASNFDQLIRYSALLLGSQIGEDVTTISPRGQKTQADRLKALTASLAADGTLSGTLRVPNTAGDLDLTADLHARQIVVSATIAAPDDRGTKARATWLVKQLGEAPEDLRIESFAKNARRPVICSLGILRADRSACSSDSQPPARFHLVLTRPMGQARKSGGKIPGFIDSALQSLADFYGSTLQNITTWQPKAPKISKADEPLSSASDLAIQPEPSLYGAYWPPDREAVPRGLPADG